MIFDKQKFVDTYGDDKEFYDGLVPDALKYLDAACTLYPKTEKLERIQLQMAIQSIAQDLFLRDLQSACSMDDNYQILFEMKRVLKFFNKQ